MERVREGEQERGKERDREGDKLNLMYLVIRCRIFKSNTDLTPAITFPFKFS